MSTPTHRLRRRFTLLYCAMSVLSAVILLALVYFLARDLPPADAPAPPGGPGSVPAAVPAAYRAFRVDMLVVPGIALAVMAPVSLLLGWLFAGRTLRPVRTMTADLRQISGSNIHRRLAMSGPRDEFKDLADTIDGLLGRLEAALDGHKRFVANAAHELRTPLTVEHALLEEPLIDPQATAEDYRANFERLLVVNRRRGRLLESLLTLAGSEHGRGPTEPVDLAEIARPVVAERAAEAQRRGLTVTTSLEPAGLPGDPALLARLLANLYDNALHYNVSPGTISLGTRTGDGTALLSIANTGPVIPAAEVERLFEPFQRLHRVADDGRHGLGLSIVRAIADAHGARLTAYARPGGGLEVQIAFPARDHPGE
ncbi:sensor histidine kinase [Hamadaea tsunoensis]|uniref:sensor histidine kinase n=1 Tax=Hamadaea tsunoensis TaxID=53368 RepID=UPI0003F8B3D4|nr:HAMP domain-containing sensor histidine kinase [Hamadaea tsunoensis]